MKAPERLIVLRAGVVTAPGKHAWLESMHVFVHHVLHCCASRITEDRAGSSLHHCNDVDVLVMCVCVR